jgi:hypothetical protein
VPSELITTFYLDGTLFKTTLSQRRSNCSEAPWERCESLLYVLSATLPEVGRCENNDRPMSLALLEVVNGQLGHFMTLEPTRKQEE